MELGEARVWEMGWEGWEGGRREREINHVQMMAVVALLIHMAVVLMAIWYTGLFSGAAEQAASGEKKVQSAIGGRALCHARY